LVPLRALRVLRGWIWKRDRDSLERIQIGSQVFRQANEKWVSPVAFEDLAGVPIAISMTS